jgi:hypothetical protein
MKQFQQSLRALAISAVVLLVGAWQGASANQLKDLGDSTPAALRAPHVFVVYWGPEWTQGFTSNNVSSAQYRNYLESFLYALGGSRLLATQTQYGAGNVFDLFAGQVRFFPTEPPATPTLDDIENVVQLSQQWFGVAQPSAISNQQIFIIALPPGHGDASFAAKGGPGCAFHNDTVSRVFDEAGLFLGHPISPATYIVLPFQPDSTKCFSYYVSAQADAFGHGILDGLSKGVKHEIAEVLTDPYLGSWRDPDVSGQDETGDKCNSGPLINYGRQTGGVWNYWAVQALWSNSAGHCDLGISGRIDNPPDVSFGLQRWLPTSLPASPTVAWTRPRNCCNAMTPHPRRAPTRAQCQTSHWRSRGRSWRWPAANGTPPCRRPARSAPQRRPCGLTRPRLNCRQRRSKAKPCAVWAAVPRRCSRWRTPPRWRPRSMTRRSARSWPMCRWRWPTASSAWVTAKQRSSWRTRRGPSSPRMRA